jgi:hypothetical protein
VLYGEDLIRLGENLLFYSEAYLTLLISGF